MKYVLIITLLLPALLAGQPFQQETNTIPVEIYGWQPYAPWTKGYTSTTPELCDIDGDGDLDFFLGRDYPQVAFFVNSGSAQNALFEWYTNEYSIFQAPGVSGGSSPEFNDIDNDGDLDAFVSSMTNISSYYENEGSTTNPVFNLVQDTLRDVNGDPVYGMKADLVDLDSDGDSDFFGGRGIGIISFYRNIGTQDSFIFQLDESPFENIDVGSGARPCFTDLDADKDFDLLIGNDNGKIWYYQNIGDSIQWDFQLITSNFNSIDVYNRATPTTAQIDGDDDYDLFSGREASAAASRGDIFFWENEGTPEVADFQYITSEYMTMDEGSDASQCFGDLDADGDFDMLIGSGYNMSFFLNTSTPTDPFFVLQTEDYQDLTFNFADPVLYDIDADGDLDLITGEGTFTQGIVKFYLNRGTQQQANFEYWMTVTQPGAWGSAIDVADIDGDGDGDLFFGDAWGDLYYFENTGTPTNPSYTFVMQNFQGIDYAPTIFPRFYDWDEDGDFDLFLGGVTPSNSRVAYYENVGTPYSPQLQLITNDFFDDYYGFSLSLVDIDADGDQDFYFGANAGGITFLRNLAISSVPPLPRTAPYKGPVLEVGPNPANPVTTFSFELRSASSVNLEVYDVSGRRVAELLSGRQEAGAHVVTWDASGLGSGVYLARLQVGGESQAGKVVVVK